MRLFIAIKLDELEGYLLELQEKLPEAKLSKAKSFHLTLKFLGEVTPDNAEKAKEALKSINFEKFSFNLDSVGVFPSEDYARVVWIGINPEDKVIELQKKVDDSLKELFKKEKSFKPHITLARVKYIGDKKAFVEKLKKINVEKRKIEVNDFRLVKSNLSPKGAVYGDLWVYGSK